MKHALYLFIVLLLPGCRAQEPQPDGYVSESLQIERIGVGIYKHISYLETETYGKVPCNGMVYWNGDESIVYDTPTNDQAASELIDWLQNTQNKQVNAVIVTHFHIDCLGGLKEFHKRGIASYASNSTIALAREQQLAVPERGFDQQIELKVGKATAIGRFFGEGHTRDNIIGYLPGEAALFGGCLVKERNAGKGNLADANTAEWASTVRQVKSAFPGVKTVVPGHGEHGGMELLDYTIQLFETE